MVEEKWSVDSHQYNGGRGWDGKNNNSYESVWANLISKENDKSKRYTQPKEKLEVIITRANYITQSLFDDNFYTENLK